MNWIQLFVPDGNICSATKYANNFDYMLKSTTFGEEIINILLHHYDKEPKQQQQQKQT